jgi:hypothetical protein
MKNLFIAVFCFVSILILNSCGGESNKDAQFLVQNSFYQSNIAGGRSLEFKDDQTYTLEEFGSDPSETIKTNGEWELKDNTVFLHPKKCLMVGKELHCNTKDVLGEAEGSVVDSDYLKF